MSDDHVTALQVGIIEEEHDLPVFVATDGDTVWRDDHPSGSIDAAYYGEDEHGHATELETQPDTEWYEIELLDCGGVWYARHSDSMGAGEMGDMPGEAASYLTFPPEETSDPVTDEEALDDQIEEIMNSGITDIYEPRFVHWLVNEAALSQDVSVDEVEETIEKLVDDDDSPISTTEYDEYHSTEYWDGW